jgi:hypothetical protein
MMASHRCFDRERRPVVLRLQFTVQYSDLSMVGGAPLETKLLSGRDHDASRSQQFIAEHIAGLNLFNYVIRLFGSRNGRYRFV